LMALLRARLAAHAMVDPMPEAPEPIRIGPFEFSLEDKALRRCDANLRIRLTEKEAAILAFLHRMGERAVPRQELLTEVWGYHPEVTTHTLETHIYRLRRKIEADPAKASLLITEAGGYRLAAGH
jgi:DNA-binding response OmpR family regulator